MTLFNLVHFTRPEWLLLIPIVGLLGLLFTMKATHQGLKQLVAPHLLAHLTHEHKGHSLNKWLGMLSSLLLCLGLSGISFDKSSTPLYVAPNKTIFVVDQSLSMYATDVRPNRQTKAKQILRDILNQDMEGEFALVAFAGDAYVISPFTQDKQTLIHFLVALDPVIMPLYGSQFHKGLELATGLLDPTDTNAHIIAITDDLNDQDAAFMEHNERLSNLKFDAIALGTEAGANIRVPNGETLRRNGFPILAKTPVEKIQQATNNIGGNFYTHDLTPTDLQTISQSSDFSDARDAKDSGVLGVTWNEQGHWFALPFLLWMLWQFKTRALFVFLVALPLLPQQGKATPMDWFKTPDQKAQEAVNLGDWEGARALFENPNWKAASHYATEDYDKAAELLREFARSPEEYYNLGNALALKGDLDKAIEAYKNALKQKPNFKEAQQNLEYLQDLKEQQKQQQEQNNQQGNQQNKQQNTPDKTQQNSKDNPRSEDENQDTQSQTQDKDPLNQDNQSSSSTEQDNSSQDMSSSQETQQALDQWLRQIQDDPGTLLQRKLWYLHQERRNENRFNEEEGMQPW